MTGKTQYIILFIAGLFSIGAGVDAGYSQVDALDPVKLDNFKVNGFWDTQFK